MLHSTTKYKFLYKENSNKNSNFTPEFRRDDTLSPFAFDNKVFNPSVFTPEPDFYLLPSLNGTQFTAMKLI
jgi:hypothetical protein